MVDCEYAYTRLKKRCICLCQDRAYSEDRPWLGIPFPALSVTSGMSDHKDKPQHAKGTVPYSSTDIS